MVAHVTEAPAPRPAPPGESFALPMSRRDGATRVLASAVLTHDRFGDAVHRDLCVPKLQAVPPAPGIDLVVVARYAAWALRRKREREVGLAACAGLMAFTFLLLFGGLPLAVAFWAMVGTGCGAWAWRTAKDHAIARKAVDAFRLDEVFHLGADLVPPAQAARLAGVNGSNLSLYSRERDDPFPGLGHAIGDSVMPPVRIDLPASRDEPVLPVSPAEMHEHLIRTIPTLGFEDIEVRNVMRLAGDWVPHVPILRPDPWGPPVTTAPAGMVYQVANEPRDSMRTYLCAQLVRHGGALVTTLDVRARMAGGILSWDVVSHLLTPIGSVYSLARSLPVEDDKLLWRVFRHPRANLLKELLRAPSRAWELHKQVEAERVPARMTSEQQRLVDPYGADTGLREYVSRDTDVDFHQKVDARDDLQRLSTAVYRGVVSYLQAHNVDVSELVEKEAQAVGTIINNLGPVSSYSFTNTGNINGSNVGNWHNTGGGGGHNGGSSNGGMNGGGRGGRAIGPAS